MELRACNTAVVTNRRLVCNRVPMQIDQNTETSIGWPGHVYSSSPPKYIGVSHIFQALFTSSLYLLSDSHRVFPKLFSKHVRCEIDKFRVGTHLCKLCDTPAARLFYGCSQGEHQQPIATMLATTRSSSKDSNLLCFISAFII